MAMIMNITTIATGLSVIFLLGLLFIYIKNYLKIKSKYTAGLLIFVVLFLVQNATSLYYFLTMMDLYVSAVAVHVLIFSILQAIGFLVMLVISWD